MKRFLILLLFCVAPAAPAAEPRPLPAEKQERTLAGGESQEWTVTLDVDGFLSVVFEQQGIDVAVEAFGPDGTSLVTVDSPNGRVGPEPLTLIAASAGVYRIVVRSSADVPAGSYEIRAVPPRPATAGDRRRHATERAQLAAHVAGEASNAESYRESVRLYKEVLAEWRALGERSREAEVLYRMGTRWRVLGDLREAGDVLRQARSIFDELGDRRGEGTAWNQLGMVEWAGNDADASRNAYRAAIEIWDELGDAAQKARTLNNFGLVNVRTGRYDDALAAYRRSLESFRQAGDTARVLVALNNIGGVLDLQGDPAGALEAYEEALELAVEVGDRRREAEALNNLGVLFFRLGEAQNALERYQAALPIFRELADRRREAAARRNLGVLYVRLRDPERALREASRALELETEIGNKLGQALNLKHLGDIYAELGAVPRARASYERSLGIFRELEDRKSEAESLRALARRGGNPEEALALLDEAARIYDAVGFVLGQTRVLVDKGDVLTSQGASGEAAKVFERTLALSRKIGAPYEESRSLHGLAEVERAGGNLRQALVHARLALEKIESQRTSIADHELRVSYFAALQDTYELVVELLVRTAGEDAARVAEALQIAERRLARGLVDQLREARLELRRDVDPVLLAKERDLQSGLDEDTVLLEYLLGANASFLWSVTPTSLAVHVLPGREEIEGLVREAHGLLREENVRDAARRREVLATLGRLLLDPVAAELGEKRLAIVADGALQYLPFAVLPLDGKNLVATHEIVSLPSAMVLAELRRPNPDRPPVKGALALFSDPVFSSDDPRVGAAARAVEGSGETARGNLSPGSAASFERLPWTRREAEAIVAALAGRVPESEIFAATGFASHVEAVTSPALGSYRIVHFATHGHLDTVRPELSALVLSQVDPEGRPRQGFLHLSHIYNLRWGADLVVLSGCRTALGREIRGEGLQSLTRGFFHAGVPRVVASLWPVQDRATAELMSRFYRALFDERLEPAAALRAAQVSLQGEPEFRDPYYWGAFILQGDWKPPGH